MPASDDSQSPVELLADEFLARCKRGEKPTIKEYCDRHPELAGEIRDVFEAVLMVEDLKPGSDDVSGSFGESVQIDGKRLQQIGDYRILCQIGRGGMGVVYEAEQQALGRRVALKVLPKTTAGDGQAQIRIQREAKAAARMHHTNIVPVFDVGQDGDYLYYAMQLIHGQGLDAVIDDLRRLRAQSGKAPLVHDPAVERSIAASLVAGKFEQENLAQEEPASHSVDPNATATYEGSAPSPALLPGQSEISTVTSNRGVYFRSVAQIGVQVASALAYAHSRGIIHRDIKPGNLILDTTGNAWVTDFGLAKTGEGAMTHTGDVLGTLRYMSPERFKGQCDVRGDVYALGMTLYELLTLKTAYASSDRLQLIELIRHSEAASPRSIDVRIPRDLETIVMKAIDKEPRRRYQSADEMGEDLQHFVNDEPIKARRVGSVERLARWCRRNPAVAGLAAVIVLLLLGVTAASMSAADHYNRLATQEAESAQKEREAREAADRAREDAEKNFARARQVVDDYLTKVSESDLIKVPGLQPLRRELLQAAQKYYQDFLKDRADDPALTNELAGAQLRLARIDTELGLREEARRGFDSAIAGYEAALRKTPDDMNLQFQLAEAWGALDWMQFQIDQGGGHKHAAQQAVKILEELVKADPTSSRYKRSLARQYNSLALAQQPTQETSQALKSYQRCLELREELALSEPLDAAMEHGLGEVLGNTSDLLNKTGRTAEALILEDRGRRHFLNAHRQAPQVVEYAIDLAIGYHNQAFAYLKLGQKDKALAGLEQEIRHLSGFVEANPSVTQAHYQLYVALKQLAVVQADAGLAEEALRTLTRATQETEHLSKDGGENLFHLARAHALQAKLIARNGKMSGVEKGDYQRYLDLGCQALASAISAGFRDAARLKRNTDLALLRDQPGYKQCVAQLDALAKTQATRPSAAPEVAPLNIAKAAPATISEADKKELQLDVALTQHAIAAVQTWTNDLAAAPRSLERATAALEAYAKEDPKNFRVRLALAAAGMTRGLLEWRDWNRVDATRTWEKSLDSLAGIVRENPGNTEATEYLRDAYRL
jgi:serine/threonine protein kinase/tetratricopeptide (TPR) repeat protein